MSDTIRDPETAAEWRLAVDAAQFMLMLDSARLFGLLTGGPEVDVERCLRVLESGRTRGVFPKDLSRPTHR